MAFDVQKIIASGLPKVAYDSWRRSGLDESWLVAAMEAALVESGFKNINYGDRDSVGILQQRPSQGWGSVSQIMNPTYAFDKFFAEAKKLGKGSSPGQKAQSVQRSAYPDRYDKQEGTAKAIIAALGHSGGGGGAGANGVDSTLAQAAARSGTTVNNLARDQSDTIARGSADSTMGMAAARTGTTVNRLMPRMPSTLTADTPAQDQWRAIFQAMSDEVKDRYGNAQTLEEMAQADEEADMDDGRVLRGVEEDESDPSMLNEEAFTAAEQEDINPLTASEAVASQNDTMGSLSQSTAQMLSQHESAFPDGEEQAKKEEAQAESSAPATTGGKLPPLTWSGKTPDLKPNAVRGYRYVKQLGFTGRIGGWGSRNYESDHAHGGALDIMVGTGNNAEGDKYANFFYRHRGELGVKYIIWNGKIASASKGWEWRPYRHPEGRTDDTAMHRDHPHISFYY